LRTDDDIDNRSVGFDGAVHSVSTDTAMHWMDWKNWHSSSSSTGSASELQHTVNNHVWLSDMLLLLLLLLLLLQLRCQDCLSWCLSSLLIATETSQ